jgi:Zn/Cd-binding protein ZinT
MAIFDGLRTHCYFLCRSAIEASGRTSRHRWQDSGCAKEQQDPKDVGVYMTAYTPKFFLVDPDGHWRAVYDPHLASGLLAANLQKVLATKIELNHLSSQDIQALDSSRA